MFRNPFRKFAAKVVQPDPQPEPSILDTLDSRGTVALDDDEAPPMTAAYKESLLALRERLTRPDEDDWIPVHFEGGMKVTTESDRITAFYAREDAQKRSAWS